MSAVESPTPGGPVEPVGPVGHQGARVDITQRPALAINGWIGVAVIALCLAWLLRYGGDHSGWVWLPVVVLILVAASLESGYPNAAVLAAPEEMLPHRPWVETRKTDTGNASFRQMQCQSLQSSALNTVIADARIARALDCPGFRQERRQGELVVVTRRDS